MGSDRESVDAADVPVIFISQMSASGPQSLQLEARSVSIHPYRDNTFPSNKSKAC